MAEESEVVSRFGESACSLAKCRAMYQENLPLRKLGPHVMIVDVNMFQLWGGRIFTSHLDTAWLSSMMERHTV